MLQSQAGLPERDQLTAVNRFFNQQLSFRDDSRVWQQIDYWATPVEALVKGAGDCEDYALGKYFSLRQLGVPAEKLRITYVKALTRNQAHMVLTYYPSPTADPLVLDNLISDIRPEMLVKGGDYGIDQVVGADIVKAYGGTVKVLGLVENSSTTAIVEKIRSK